MEKFRSLADVLGLPPIPGSSDDPNAPREPQLEDITDSKAFALAVLNSRDFRSYIVQGLFLRDIPPMILARLMDHAWGKPVDRVEHSGRVDSVTEVRRVVIHVEDKREAEELEMRDALLDPPKPKYGTH